MPHHPALEAGRTAVITGGGSGIGLAMAERCVRFGMNVVLADVDGDALGTARDRLTEAGARPGTVIAVRTDVSNPDQIERLRTYTDSEFGIASFLMNNAGRGGPGRLFADPDVWRAVLETNLWGVVHGIDAFVPDMIAAKQPGLVVNTGSKQGITTPPGDTAYNVSKAGVKVVTEALAHELRQIEGCAVTAHLLVPGFTFTPLTAGGAREKPAGAWTPEQVIDFLLASLERGDFYVLCPDNEVTRDMDERRIRWAADDLVLNRPALSRWHPDFAEAFKTFMDEGKIRR